MPRYDVLCKDCDKKTIVLLFHCAGDADVKEFMIRCEFCQSKNTKLVSFFADATAQIEYLTEEIERIDSRIDRLCEDTTIEHN